MNFKAKVGPVSGDVFTVMGFSWRLIKRAGNAIDCDFAHDRAAQADAADRAPVPAVPVVQS